MKNLIYLVLSFCFIGCTSPSAPNDKEQKIRVKVNTLLTKMTLEEKLEQMMQDAPENTRLGIPSMIYSEALHGLWLKGGTVFPQAIALGSTWQPSLLQEMNTYVAKEARSIGITQCYSPNLDVLTGDPRYGRVEESYGEDPYLVSQMGVAFIKGMQGVGKEHLDKNHIIATAKHFAGYPENRTGLNGGFVDLSKRRMYEIYFPPFEAAVQEAHVESLMPGHEDLNGIPCHMNTWLLKTVLRDEFGFDGFLISDNNDVTRLCTQHLIARTKTEAALLALKAGVDMELVIGKAKVLSSYIPEVLKDTLQKNSSLMQSVDASVRHILTAKYRLGLFDESLNKPENKELTSSIEAQACALKIAHKAVILLKNKASFLPLNKDKIRSIAVIGPNASEDQQKGSGHYLQLGSYSGVPPYYTSILEGIQQKVGAKVKVNYAKGCDYWSDSKAGFPAALLAARKSDVVILAIGGSTETCGEGKDRDNLNLTGVQNELVEAVSKIGKPFVVILLNGRPLTIEPVVKKATALIEGWYLGMRTGDALADVLFGDYNPGGKLTVSFPRNIGQLPKTYLVKPDFIGTGKGQYEYSSKEPLFPFGYGLSYTSFVYDQIQLSAKKIRKGKPVTVQVNVTNVGQRDGDEVIQLYVRDDYASVGRYVKRLKAFRRVGLKKGQTKTVKFELGPESFELYNASMEKVIEPGAFTLYVGGSSREKDLKTIQLEVVE
ncbi:MAG: glycoside hydrolase family 3 C-terminal domain-containing protein [Massilibacteroides sp.]|nr:glycoside hydrolase family 3 C-terminal domain-containing protein [Massilibacteroides sp.]